MEPHVLLTQLRAHLAQAPDFAAYTPSSTEHQAWLGRAHALLTRWNKMEAVTFKVSADFLPIQANRQQNIGQIFGALYRAIADLELQLPKEPDQVFGPGAVYDFFKALSEILQSAEKEVFIADPYVDDSIFDTYLSSVPAGVAVRLLAKKHSVQVAAAAQKYTQQYKAAVGVKTSQTFHDRLVFIDRSVCWVIGQSIKDAAATKPTYLAPLSSDVTPLKLKAYEDLWAAAAAI